jgi:biopolymer transport protein ExbD
LPQASMEKVLDKPENIRLSVDADGVYFWNDQRVDDADFANRLTAAAAQEPQPELHIRGDKAVRYERVAQAMAAAQRSGVRKIGFITEPTTP